jgi:hypothetical protein
VLSGAIVFLALLLFLLLVWVLPIGAVFLVVARVGRRWAAVRERQYAISTAVSIVLFVALHALPDGWPGSAGPLLFLDDTQFSPTYSATGFLRVSRGMREAEVEQLAGTPLERYQVEPGLYGWRWTRSPHDSHYRVRSVLFRDGRVVNKASEFYVD